jgi:hypothetical protein
MAAPSAFKGLCGGEEATVASADAVMVPDAAEAGRSQSHRDHRQQHGDTWRRRMEKLRDLWFIRTKKGPSGEFHYVLLLNPNAAMEWMRTAGLMQDGLYARFLDRVIEVGAHAELEAIRDYWKLARETYLRKQPRG